MKERKKSNRGFFHRSSLLSRNGITIFSNWCDMPWSPSRYAFITPFLSLHLLKNSSVFFRDIFRKNGIALRHDLTFKGNFFILDAHSASAELYRENRRRICLQDKELFQWFCTNFDFLLKHLMTATNDNLVCNEHMIWV